MSGKGSCGCTRQLLRERQAHTEVRAGILTVDDLDAATMRLYEFRYHRKTDAGSLEVPGSRRSARVERVENGSPFDAFYSGRAPTSGHLKGTGIGLSVVSEFVQAHGGSVEILDGVFPGAHFRIRLPLAPQLEVEPA